MANQKIGIYITDITRKAGTERVVVNLANYLSSQGNEVTVVSFCSKEGTAFFDLHNSVRIYHLNLKGYADKPVVFKWYYYFVNLYLALICCSNLYFDIVIGSSRNVNTYALLFKRKKQIIIGCEHFAFNVPMSGLLRKFRNWIYKYLDELVVLTERDRKYYASKGIQVRVIPNALPFEPIHCREKKEKIVLAVGRHSTQKAFDKLIYIWSKANCRNQGWKLFIVGDGALKASNWTLVQKQNLEGSVTFIPLSRNIQEFYSKASIYVMTSLYEAFPMVLLEAKACEVPVISYDCDTGPREIVADGQDGFVVDLDNEQEFIEKLELLAENKSLREQFGEKALQNSYRYSFENIMPVWDQLIVSHIPSYEKDFNS